MQIRDTTITSVFRSTGKQGVRATVRTNPNPDTPLTARIGFIEARSVPQALARIRSAADIPVERVAEGLYNTYHPTNQDPGYRPGDNLDYAA